VRLRTWLRRADIVFKPVAFLAALLAAWVCGYDPEHGRAYPGDLHIAESIVAVLAFAVLVRAVARNVLESLWRPASAPHLAPILREDEVDWLWVAAAILVTVIQFLPIVVGPKGDVGLPAMVVTALVLARVGARLLRRQRVSSTKARKRRARHQSDAGWRVARRSMVLGEYQVPIDYLEYNETNIQALTDEQFARFRSDLKSTVVFGRCWPVPGLTQLSARTRGIRSVRDSVVTLRALANQRRSFDTWLTRTRGGERSHGRAYR
jgi:hypothetical protein